MKIIVTGALGHIGSHLIRQIPNYLPGSEMIMIDNLMTQRYSSLYNLPDNLKYRFLELDLVEEDLNALFEGFDVVIHLAAITDAAGSFEKADLVEFNNFNCTKKVADACVVNGCKLIHLSSTSVYGTQGTIVDENCTENDLKPQSPYALTKLKEENYIKDLFIKSGLKAVTCRFGTIFGKSIGMRFHTAVNKFCWQAVMQQPITVWSTAYDQKRPYLDLEDATNAIFHIIENDIFDGNVYNVLTINATVREIVESISTFVSETKINFVDSPIMNQLSYEVSTEKLKATGFITKGNMKQAIQETLSLLGNK